MAAELQETESLSLASTGGGGGPPVPGSQLPFANSFAWRLADDQVEISLTSQPA